MTTPTLESVQAYYDERVHGKIRDFTHSNPRIEAAVQLVAEWAPPNPKRILEIGCGIGATCWRMARAWPDAEVIGADVSLQSIEVAKTCFQRPNLSYRAGLVAEGVFAGSFDLVVLMDVYEHIAMSDRTSLHRAIKSLLSDEARVIMTVPTPAVLSYLREVNPSEIQPVDEDVTPQDIINLAKETDTQLLCYREVGIWHYGDYAHVVAGRYQSLAEVKLRECRPELTAALKQHAKRLLGRQQILSAARCDYLGSDTLRPTPRRFDERFNVSASIRRRLVSSWLRRNPGKADSQRLAPSQMDLYLAPPCRPSTLDSFGNRRLLLRALKGALANFKGRLLDVGCGYQPYRSLLLAPPSQATDYVGLDLPDNLYQPPDLAWDGQRIPLADASMDSAMLTEVLEHCPDPEAVLAEVARVLTPGGFLFLTVPFIWPLHTVPHDEFRYTPFALRRLLERSGFRNPVIEATGGRHAVLALTLGLWVRRRPLTSRVHVATRAALSILLWPVIWLLLKIDKRPQEFEESTMIVGLSARASKIQ